MTHTQQRIEEIRRNGYQLNFLDVFNHALENYKKIALYAGLIIYFFHYILSIFGFLAFDFGIQNFISLQKNSDSLGQLILIYMSKELLLALFIAPFIAGFLKIADCADKNEKFNVFTIFYYCRLSYLRNITGAALLISIVKLSVSVYMQTQDLSFLGRVISLLISVFTCLTIPLIIFGNLNAVKAIKTGLMVTSKKPLILTGVMVVFIGFLGLEKMTDFIKTSGLKAVTESVMFLIRVILILITPFVYFMIYAIYSSIIGLEIEKPDSEISS